MAVPIATGSSIPEPPSVTKKVSSAPSAPASDISCRAFSGLYGYGSKLLLYAQANAGGVGPAATAAVPSNTSLTIASLFIA